MAAAADAQNEPEYTTEQEIVAAFNKKRQLQQQCMSKIAEMESQLHEYVLVQEQLKTVDDARRCHRLVGGALIEKTAGEVKPEIADSLRLYNEALNQLQTQLKQLEENLEAFMTKYKITIKKPGAEGPGPAKSPAQGGAAGLLA